MDEWMDEWMEGWQTEMNRQMDTDSDQMDERRKVEVDGWINTNEDRWKKQNQYHTLEIKLHTLQSYRIRQVIVCKRTDRKGMVGSINEWCNQMDRKTDVS